MTKYTACPDHPGAPLDGRPGGDIKCVFCERVLGRWNLPWSPRWMCIAEDTLGRTIARRLPRSVVKWAVARATAHATEGRWRHSAFQAITAAEVSRRWEIA